MIDLITDHISKAKDRLATQYEDSANLISILDSFNEQIQDLENTLHSLIEGRWLNVATGQTLDDFGTIVGQDRLGFTDEFYRILILVKIAENISEGEPERLIDAYKTITEASLGYIEELFPAGVYLMSNGSIVEGTEQFIFEKLQKIAPAGVRVDYIGHFNDLDPFAFEGFPNASTFDDGTAQPTAGVWSFTYDTSKPFSFEDGSDKTDGFGTSDDHRVGGYFVTE